MVSLRTWLVLGRASNLPTVWSNCLAGWLLAGGGDARRLSPLLLAATLLYLAGMFLNDAFDAQFDAQHRRERPIPSGIVTVQIVWKIGFSLMAAGVIILFFLGKTAGLLGILLAICILLYDAVHKLITLSPILMAGCRFLLYLVAASVSSDGLSGWPIWCGLALGGYIVGLSFIARKENGRAELNYWPLFFLAAPIALACLMNMGSYRQNAWLLSAVVVLWCARSLRQAFRKEERNVGRAVSGLLAGIVIVDLLAVADAPHSVALIFFALFLLALFFQRFVPAT